jgi:hypothetical protein
MKPATTQRAPRASPKKEADVQPVAATPTPVRKAAEPPKPIAVSDAMAQSLISQRYEAGGWHISPRPHGLICDFIAVNGTRCHMIKIVGASALDNNPQATPVLAENDFIRAAAQIAAVPVYVAVSAKAKRTGDLDYSTTFRQAGSNSPVIIGK